MAVALSIIGSQQGIFSSTFTNQRRPFSPIVDLSDKKLLNLKLRSLKSSFRRESLSLVSALPTVCENSAPQAPALNEVYFFWPITAESLL